MQWRNLNTMHRNTAQLYSAFRASTELVDQFGGRVYEARWQNHQVCQRFLAWVWQIGESTVGKWLAGSRAVVHGNSQQQRDPHGYRRAVDQFFHNFLCAVGLRRADGTYRVYCHIAESEVCCSQYAFVALFPDGGIADVCPLSAMASCKHATQPTTITEEIHRDVQSA